MSQVCRVAVTSVSDLPPVPMFDILVYLFENDLHPESWAGGEALAGTLSDAGFDDEEISEALTWLSELREVATQPLLHDPGPDSLRFYSPDEEARLDVECRGFLAFLESSGALDAATREIVVGRALALEGFRLDVHRLKIIVLMVLWQKESPLDVLILDELLAGNDDFPDASLQ
jgi:Smg protein